MLKGYKTNKLVPLTLTLDAAIIRMDARLSLIPMQNGQVGLGIHGIRKEPQLERPYFGHIFTEEDKKNLRESGNMGRVAELNLRGGTTEPCLISIDKSTNELVAVRQEHVYVQDEVRGVKLSPDEIQTLKNGGQVFVDGMISNKGKEFSATLQYSAERRGLEFIFPKDQAFNQQSLGGVQLSPTQLKMLSEGHTILVEDMKRRNSDEVFSSFVTLDKVTDVRTIPATIRRQAKSTSRRRSATCSSPMRTRNCSVRDSRSIWKHDQPQGRGVLRLCQTEHDHRQPAILPYPGRVQRAAGTAHSGGSVRPCVHRTGESKPPGRKDHSHF